MCGRFTLTLSLIELLEWLDFHQLPFEFFPRYNIAPGQMITAVIAHQGQKRIGQLKWGLIPSWAEDEKIGYKMINARAETLEQKPAFRESFQRRRCLIPTDGFYEWQSEGGKKRPMRIVMKSRQPFAMAGLYDTWVNPDGAKVHSCTIITTAANELLSPIHDRMPVILREQDWDIWLDRGMQDTKRLAPYLQPYPAAEMKLYPVSAKVGSASYEQPECILPL